MRPEPVKNILDYVFKAPEPQVRTFSETMRTPVKAAEKNDPMADAKSGKTAHVTAIALLTQRSGNVVIEHGAADHGDYVWHFQPFERHQWSTSIDRVITAIARTMNTVIPQRIRVDIFEPYLDWDVKSITFRAYGLRECWNVQDKDVTRLTLQLFTVLNALIK